MLLFDVSQTNCAFTSRPVQTDQGWCMQKKDTQGRPKELSRPCQAWYIYTRRAESIESTGVPIHRPQQAQDKREHHE